jgi:hypothetical protein
MSDKNTKKNKRLLSSAERAILFTKALNEGVMRNEQKEVKIQQGQQIHSMKEKLILTTSKTTRDRLVREISEALKRGIRESNIKKNKQLPSWEERQSRLLEALSKGLEREEEKIRQYQLNKKKNRYLPSWEERMNILKEALSKGIERNTQKQKNQVSVGSVKSNPSLSKDRISKELIDEIFGEDD